VSVSQVRIDDFKVAIKALRDLANVDSATLAQALILCCMQGRKCIDESSAISEQELNLISDEIFKMHLEISSLVLVVDGALTLHANNSEEGLCYGITELGRRRVEEMPAVQGGGQ
jgi:hypothetical protein